MILRDLLRRLDWRAWVLQDVGNSAFATTILAVLYPLYYREVLGAGAEASSVLAWWGYVSALSMLLTALLAPGLGALADGAGRRKGALLAATALGVGASAAMGLLGEGHWVWGLALFALGSLGFSFNNVFYDSFLPHLAAPEERAGLSSAGYALGYLGGGTLLVANAALAGFWGEAGFRLSFLSVALWWGLFTLPFLRHVGEPPPSPREPGETWGASAYGRPWRTLLGLRHQPDLLWFLGAFWLYNDGIGTIMRMGVLYGSSLGLGQGTLLGALVATQFVGVPCTILFGRLAGRWGDRRVLMAGLGGYLALCAFIPFVVRPWHFWVLALGVGVVQGGTQALSRSLFASLVPKERSAELYGFYDLSSKFAGVLGPFLFGLLAQLTGSLRMGGPVLGLFFLGGMAMLRRVRAGGRP
ncbi:MFS transporter [Aminomonas paucivorans]|uniref:MFS transporter n=1 Tax=Aminomonas paucivorans TaxID=81412 RepID=UPI00333392ED